MFEGISQFEGISILAWDCFTEDTNYEFKIFDEIIKFIAILLSKCSLSIFLISELYLVLLIFNLNFKTVFLYFLLVQLEFYKLC